MLNLLNAVVGVFGSDKSWNSDAVVFWLVYAQIAILVVLATIIGYVIMKRRAHRAGETVVVADAQPATVQQNTEVIYVHEPAEEEERMLTGITLDLGVVQREFTAGDEFDCNGLVVNAEFNVMPTTESIVDYTLIDKDTYVKLERRDKLHGVYVIKPKMHTVGIKVVTVRYLDKTAAYTVSVNAHEVEEPTPVVEETAEPATVVEKHVVEQPVIVEKVVEQPVVVEHVVEKPVIVERVVERPVIIERVVEKPVIVEHVMEVPVEVEADEDQHVVSALEVAINDEESVEAGKLRYDKSFTARVIQSNDETKHWYTEVKNELLSYKTCKGRISWKRETFKANKQVVAMLVYRGKTLCLFLPLNPADFDEEYRLEDASDVPAYGEIPALLRLKNDKRVRIAKELIARVMEQAKVVRDSNYISEDFYVPYEGILELINKGLVKREIRSSTDEAIFVQGKINDDDE